MDGRLRFVLLYSFYLHTGNGLKDPKDPGTNMLAALKAYPYLKEPVNMENDIICNCSVYACDTELAWYLKEENRFCRTNGVCIVQVKSGEGPSYACMKKDLEMFCMVNKPLKDGTVIKCCKNRSFCNGDLQIDLPKKDPEFLITSEHGIFIVGVTCTATFICVLMYCLSLFNKRAKKWLSFLRRKTPLISSSGDAEQKLLKQKEPFDGQVQHINVLLTGLDDSGTTGSGSGLPLLVQRTIARQIELHTEIGKGRFGEVWLGSWKGEPVAVKIFSTRDERSWNREVEVFQTNMLRHSNILRFIASDNKDTGTSMQLWLVTEYHSHGSLYDYLSDNTISEAVTLKMIRSIANGLAFLHAEIPGMHSKPAIAHRDLKSKNILVKADLSCVIADMGLAVRYANGIVNLPDNNKCGTVRYLSPEILSDSFISDQFDAYKMSDMYAVGLIIWEITRRIGESADPLEPPYYEFVSRDPSTEEMRQCVCVEKHRPSTSQFWSKQSQINDVRRVMCECWTEVPSNRLTAMNVRIAMDRIAAAVGWNIVSPL